MQLGAMIHQWHIELTQQRVHLAAIVMQTTGRSIDSTFSAAGVSKVATVVAPALSQRRWRKCAWTNLPR